MAQMGLGYGSEFQLLRFLGHHRDSLDKEIKEQIGDSGDIQWLDFDFSKSKNSISGDKEKKGLSFLQDISFISNEQYTAVNNEYHSYNINKLDSWQNWDAIFTMNETVYLVEAKAHVGELASGHKEHGGESKDEILRFIKEQLLTLKVSEKWLKEYYQLANRLATAALLNKHGIKTKVVYLFFENGYKKDNKNATRQDFKEAIQAEYNALEINHEMVSHLVTPSVFINATPKLNNMRKKINITILALICGANLFAQSTIEEVYKTIADGRSYYSFEAFDNKILGYSVPFACVYDEKWNVIEAHDAGNDTLTYYNSTYSDGKESKTKQSRDKYDYRILSNHLSDFLNGKTNVLYYFQEEKEIFIRSHDASNSWFSNYYTSFTTGVNVVDWDGNLICKLTIPYYASYFFGTDLKVKDEIYFILYATSIYPKSIIKTMDLKSFASYDVGSKKIDDYSHYFIYKYDKNTNSIELINTQKSKKAKTEIGIYDINGTKLLSPIE